MKARVLVLMVCISLAAVAVLAHGGEEHVIGVVSKVAPDSITVKTAAKMVTVAKLPLKPSSSRAKLPPRSGT